MVKHRTGSIPVLGTKLIYIFHSAGWSSLVARRAHNPEVVGSNPAPATKILSCSGYGGIAQLARACGSYPQCRRFKSVFRYQIWPHGQAVKTPPFHGGIPGSNPGGVTIIFIYYMFGRIAQLGEHLPYKQGVIGSSPIAPTKHGLVVQLVRMLACHARGRGFESLPGRQC